MENTIQEMPQDTPSSNPLERTLELVISKVEVDKEVDLRLKKMAKTAKMPGFRPGKVPIKLIRQNHGYETFSKVLEEQVQTGFSIAIKEQGHRLAGPPKATNKESTDPEKLVFSFSFEVYPEIVLGDLSGQVISRPVFELSDAEVDKTIEVLRKQRTLFEDTDGPAQAENRVVLDFTGRRDGEPFVGGSSTDFPFVLGSGQMLPDFDAAVVGLRAGETKTFSLRFPEDYQTKDLANVTVEFDIHLKKVQIARLPDLDAAFAQALGVEDGDLETMRAEVRSNLAREVQHRIDARIRSAVLDAVLAVTAFSVPKALVEKEIQILRDRAKENLQMRGLHLDDIEPINSGWFSLEAERRVRSGLIFAHIEKREQLDPSMDQVMVLLRNFALSYEDPEKMMEWCLGKPERMLPFVAMATEANVVEWVLKNAQVKDTPVTFDELMNDAVA